MTKKVVFSICTAMIVVFSFGFFKVNFLDRKESKLTVTNVDLQENCIYAIAKNQLYDADDEYIIHGASDYLKGQVQLSQIKEGETIIVISNGKVLQSDPYQFDTIYSIRPQWLRFRKIQAGAELEIRPIVRTQLAAVRGTDRTFASGDHMVHGVLNMAQSFVSLVAHLASPRFSSGAIRSL